MTRYVFFNSAGFRIFLTTCLLVFGTLTTRAAQVNSGNDIAFDGSTSPRSSLTVYAYPAHLPLNWSSPGGLLKSFADIAILRELHLNHDVTFVSDEGDPGSLSSYYVSTMGHALNHVSCDLPDGERYDRWVSYSGDDFASQDTKNVLTDEIGMGAIFYNYVDGYVISGQENVDRLIYNHGTQGKPRYMQFEIGPPQCESVKRMIEFYQSFYYKPGTTLAQLEARPPEKIAYYNTQDAFDAYHARMHDPHAPVGAGCAPFSGGLVKEVGHYDPLFETAWRRPVTISEKLIGQKNASGNITYRVPILEILSGSLSKDWTYPGISNQFVNMYDPTLMWSFVADVRTCLANASRCSPTMRAWIRKSRSVRAGPTQSFADTIEKLDDSGEGDSAADPVTVAQKTTMQIDGIVIRK